MRKSLRISVILAFLGCTSILVFLQKHRLKDYVKVLDTDSTHTNTDMHKPEERILETDKSEVNSLRAGHVNESVTGGNSIKDIREIELTERVYKERVKYAMSKCYTQDKRNVANVLKQDEYKLAYCKVPKVGCTFWLRILLFLYKDTGRKAVTSPFEISRTFVHNGRKKHLRAYSNFSSIQGQIEDYTRFLFARDPYSRLWSAYLDKYRLPDFWRSSASLIVNRRGVTSDKAKRCRHDVSFREFLQYVASRSPISMNEHWRPVSFHCDPCLFKPTVIGKVETFSDDAKYILRKIGHEEIMSSFSSEAYVKGELATLSDYNFDLLKGSFYKGCLTSRSVALLLWEVFQLNGYLPKEVNGTDAIKSLNIIDKESFKSYVINTYISASKEDRRRWKLQKAAALKDAFKSIPKSVTDKLVSIYENDFNMFGYESKPPA